jgi:uracil-DNA glycosylase
MSLSDLLRDARACDLCRADLPLGPRPVLQVSDQAPILIAGQAPGSKVHATGIPFDDPSGDRLRRWLGVEREVFYDPAKFAILPMGFCFPGTGKSGDLPPRPECAERWRQLFLEAMPQIEMTLIIGRYATHWHLPETKRQTLTRTVGNWRQNFPQQLPMPHPSPRNIRWFKNNPWFETEVIPALQKQVRFLLQTA